MAAIFSRPQCVNKIEIQGEQWQNIQHPMYIFAPLSGNNPENIGKWSDGLTGVYILEHHNKGTHDNAAFIICAMWLNLSVTILTDYIFTKLVRKIYLAVLMTLFSHRKWLLYANISIVYITKSGVTSIALMVHVLKIPFFRVHIRYYWVHMETCGIYVTTTTELHASPYVALYHITLHCKHRVSLPLLLLLML